MAQATPLRIAIAGLGTVGVGVGQILAESAALITARAGRPIEVVAVSSRSKGKDRGVDFSKAKWVENALELADMKEVDIVVELIGGATGVAAELAEKTLNNGKHLVTANKALLAAKGKELAVLAEENGVALGFEAAVAGGIPILKVLRESLAGNEYRKIAGIMNGTCNYILSTMEAERRDFADVLKEAQAKGYAETPPDLDIDGVDAGHKLGLITAMAFGVVPDLAQMYLEGIREITLTDMDYAKDFGYAIRLLAVTEEVLGIITQRVHPCLVKLGTAMAGIKGPQNAILVQGDRVGSVLLTGAGAGRFPTASSVLSDIVDIARGIMPTSFGISAQDLKVKPFGSINSHGGEYYLRVKVKDQPGVLAKLTGALAAANIGVENVLQRGHASDGTAIVALTTHETTEKAIQAVRQALESEDYSLEKPHLIRIEAI